ncbi:hypothetical protein [Kiloniella antarctica]|uniref:Uncharacterized protein n=1 Tax=Kiloniella antarctica TaxID=1550907 RepID=A0ABW5BNP0_9PROT
MQDFKFVIIVFLIGFISFFSFFHFSNDSVENIEVVVDIPSKSGRSATVTFWDTLGMALGLVPEVMHAEFLSPSKQSSMCQISSPSEESEIIWIDTMSSDFVSPIQIENGAVWPSTTKLINVSVGRFNKPVFLFLQSNNDVVWNLNIPDSVVVEGVVTASLLPSAIANVPEGVEKLVTMYESNRNAICPLFWDLPSEDEVMDYFGRKPDRVIRKEIESLFVVKDVNAPIQGISRLDARKIYSPVNMLVGKEPYVLRHVEEAEKIGAIVKIDYQDALKILMTSNKPSTDSLATEIKDQFLYVSKNYRLILRDFDLPDDFLNNTPQTFFVPSDVVLSSLTIPPSVNPEPRIRPALKVAPGSDEIDNASSHEISRNEKFMNSIRMEDSDKYFRTMGKHAFAPLDLTVAEIQELVDLDMSNVE